MRLIFLTICFFSCFSLYSQYNPFPPNLFSELSFSFNKSFPVEDNNIGGVGYGVNIYQYINQKGKINVVFGLEYNHLKQTDALVTLVPRPNYPLFLYNMEYSINHLNFPIYLRLNVFDKFAVFGGIYGTYLLKSYQSSKDERNKMTKRHLEIETQPGYGVGLGYRFSSDDKWNPSVKIEYRRSKSLSRDPYLTKIDFRYIRLCLGVEF